MNKKSRTPHPQRYHHQNAYLKQPNKTLGSIAAPQREHTNSDRNSAHWFGKLPPHFQCILGLALLTLIGIMAHDSFIAHDHTMSSGLLNILTLIIYMFK